MKSEIDKHEKKIIWDEKSTKSTNLIMKFPEIVKQLFVTGVGVKNGLTLFLDAQALTGHYLI